MVYKDLIVSVELDFHMWVKRFFVVGLIIISLFQMWVYGYSTDGVDKMIGIIRNQDPCHCPFRYSEPLPADPTMVVVQCVWAQPIVDLASNQNTENGTPAA